MDIFTSTTPESIGAAVLIGLGIYIGWIGMMIGYADIRDWRNNRREGDGAVKVRMLLGAALVFWAIGMGAVAFAIIGKPDCEQHFVGPSLDCETPAPD